MITVFESANDRPSLTTMKALVGGWFRLVGCSNHPDWQIFVNDEGQLFGLPFNEAASNICGSEVLGHAVLLKGAARWN